MEKQALHKNICDNIRYLRKVHGLTQREMAAIMDVSVATLGRIERQEPRVRLYAEPLCRLCDRFHYSMDEIMYETWPDRLRER